MLPFHNKIISESNIMHDLKSRLLEKYLLPGQTEEEMLFNVAQKYSSNELHQDRIYSYMRQQHFIPATPVLIRGNKKAGMPISCFVNEYEDTKKVYTDSILNFDSDQFKTELEKYIKEFDFSIFHWEFICEAYYLHCKICKKNS